ncbi:MULTISPECIES: hypothetical protein [unclassified Nostoc]|uniref:hypothetical protein n=1 Tax=unclassified Nostoc TaxID=2593658 RepID=UPI002AD50448|nr:MULTISPECIES: hypothetical protein [unclassified Nostoc]MDZ8091040.1 hypothetical protein [Nostoc sp. DedQUE05]MDZ8129752.1 hypothetical protein [Nostoc sp. DedQUE07]
MSNQSRRSLESGKRVSPDFSPHFDRAIDDERDSIFERWLNRDELFLSEVVLVTNNISTTTLNTVRLNSKRY